MPGPIVFFVVIIVLDLILKSAKDKKKIEEARRRKVQGQNSPNIPAPKASRPMADLRRILEEEIQKERQKEMERKPKQSTVIKTEKPNRVNIPTAMEERTTSIREEIVQKSSVEKANKDKDVDLRKDILRGIIFSEILSEPKSIQNQRKSL